MDGIYVSVIIPVYNAEKYLNDCLNSITNQTLKEIEVICVDDASTDNSLNIIKDFSKKDMRVKYFSLLKNSGAGIARNKGLKHAAGEYISFVDSDDFIITNDAYEKLYEAAVENDAKIISGNLKVYNKDKIEESCFIECIKEKSRILPQEYGIPWYSPRNLYKKQFLEEKNIKFPDYKKGEDPVFLAKALANVDFIYCMPIDFYGYKYVYNTSPSKINNEKDERAYITHFKDVFDILNDLKFEKTVLDYENIMHKYFVDHTFVFPSKSLEKNIKIVFGNRKTLTIYKLNCSLWKKDNEIKKLKLALSKKEKVIKDITSSNSWKLTKFLRKFGTLLRNITRRKSIERT